MTSLEGWGSTVELHPHGAFAKGAPPTGSVPALAAASRAGLGRRASWHGWLVRGGFAVGYLRGRPGTHGYLAVLLTTHVVVFHLLPEAAKQRMLRGISTNLAAMGWSSPLRLIGSALVVDASGSLLNIALIVVVGIWVCLGRLEYRMGTVRAFGVFAAAHVLASLLVLIVVAAAVRSGHYPEAVTHELDYGVSYGALGAVGAATWLVPTWVRPLWAAFALLYPLTAADWYGWLPDYSSVGHVLSAAIGIGVAAVLVRYGRAQAGEPVPGSSAIR